LTDCYDKFVHQTRRRLQRQAGGDCRSR